MLIKYLQNKNIFKYQIKSIMYKATQISIDLGDGRSVTLETGKLAKQANGSVVVMVGKTMLLATVCAAKEAKENVDFMPLQVEYQESFSSVGRFPGGFMKREGKPGDNEILTARLIDRALRPMFPADYHADVFVTVELISGDRESPADAYAGLAASAALAVSDIPFNGPISEARVCRLDGKFIVNPTFAEIAKSDIELVVGATSENIIMVEGEMTEVSEIDMIEALRLAHDVIKKQCQAQLDLAAKLGGCPKVTYCHEHNDTELQQKIYNHTYQKIYDCAKANKPKHERHQGFEDIKDEAYKTIFGETEVTETQKAMFTRYYHDIHKEAVRNLILNEGKRLDGRGTSDIRPIWCEVDYLPSAHGSAIFTRGETQSLTTVTLGSKLDEKIIDEALQSGRDKFLLHYNFPPYATGEARPSRGLSRREIGHGNLAHRALKRMIPKESNPYTIRVVSDILESNGSSSMATVCAGTLALMDAGIKLTRPVSGIAMGLITDTKTGKWAVLSDILGDEDHLGDMDFKVTGTEKGITACQMDIKVGGLSYEILGKALAQANEGRAHILNIMLQTLNGPRADFKDHAPRIVQITIPGDKIGALIGPGGKVIQEIQADSKATITVEQKGDQGLVSVSAENKDFIDAALKRIKIIMFEPEEGAVYHGKVKSVVEFGAFIEIAPGREGLLHISEIDHKRIDKVSDVLKIGDEFEVKLLKIEGGKMKLSRRALLPRPEREQRNYDQNK